MPTWPPEASDSAPCPLPVPPQVSPLPICTLPRPKATLPSSEARALTITGCAQATVSADCRLQTDLVQTSHLPTRPRSSRGTCQGAAGLLPRSLHSLTQGQGQCHTVRGPTPVTQRGSTRTHMDWVHKAPGQGRGPPELDSSLGVAGRSSVLLCTPRTGVSVWLFCSHRPLLPVAFPVSSKRSDLPACSFSHQPSRSQMNP